MADIPKFNEGIEQESPKPDKEFEAFFEWFSEIGHRLREAELDLEEIENRQGSITDPIARQTRRDELRKEIEEIRYLQEHGKPGDYPSCGPLSKSVNDICQPPSKTRLRKNQWDKKKVQDFAEKEWKKNAKLMPSEVLRLFNKHCEYAVEPFCSRDYEERTYLRWIAEVWPQREPGKRGRRRKTK